MLAGRVRYFCTMQGYVPQAEYDALKAHCEKLEFQLEEFKRLIFGAKSERFVPEEASTQLSLFVASPVEEQEESAPVKETKVEGHTRVSPAKEVPKRQPLPEWLERRVEVLEPEIDTTDMVRIGEEVTERLEYEAAKLVVHQIVRPPQADAPKQDKNSAEGCTIHIAPLPTHPILRCIAAVSLLAMCRSPLRSILITYPCIGNNNVIAAWVWNYPAPHYVAG